MMKAAILGCGVIGAGWAARFLLMGWDVVVFDPQDGADQRLMRVIDAARRALPMIYDTGLPDEGRLTFAQTLSEAVAGADWVQESVPERIELKMKVYQTVQAHCDPDAILASSTSGFTPSALQSCATRPAQILVAHPFNPVYLLPLVEVVASPANPPEMVERAEEILAGVGMAPLHVRAEIDAHIADRLLEAVWRESLWLVKDGIATTAEIDDAIRLGFGLRWAQMGLFETYRIAGGEGGMAHFLAQFGPALAWPWTKLMDVPDLDAELIARIASQSDAQSGDRSIPELEQLRDDNLVALLRALKARKAAAGHGLAEHEATMREPLRDETPLCTARRVVPIDWTDQNGHMNESRYGQVFSDAADAVLEHVGAGQSYIEQSFSYFTVETKTAFRAETHAGDRIEVLTRVATGDGKKLGLAHEMRRISDGTVLATCDQLLVHVSLETRRSCPPRDIVARRIAALAAAHET